MGEQDNESKLQTTPDTVTSESEIAIAAPPPTVETVIEPQEGKSIDRAAAINAAASVVIALATLVNVGVAIYQWHAAEKSNQNTLTEIKNEQMERRAWVTNSPEEIKELPTSGMTHLKVKLHNSGNTPALDVSSEAFVFPARSSKEPDFEARLVKYDRDLLTSKALADTLVHQGPIGPASNLEVQFPWGQLDPADAKTIKTGDIKYFLLVRITYDDVADNAHETDSLWYFAYLDSAWTLVPASTRNYMK